MNWPTHTDYQDAIQNPQICFQEADLKEGTAACDMLGLPRVMSGNFASVYELSTQGRRFAVRCFVRQVMGQQGRYARLCQHLGAITLPWLVKFDYFLKGILVRGEWYPIVKMEWVEGMPINNWADENINNPDKLRKAAAQWRQVVNDMRKHSLAHGDYQHGNIMVTPSDDLRLVDYDGMYCPAFGKGRSPELGHANFQHPRRLAENYDDSLDNFSALVIYTSLLALAEEPGLWKDFYTGDNLILSSGDYKNPQNSKAFARLIASKNEQVKQLASLLQQAAMRSVSDVPWFEETVAAAEKGTLAAQVAAMPAPSEAAGTGWLAETEPVQGSRATPEVSRPSPGFGGTRPSPSPAGPTGTRIAPPHPTPAKPASAPAPAPAVSRSAPAPTPAPAPAPMATFHEEEEKGNSSKILLIIGAIAIIALIFFIFANRGPAAPNLDQTPSGQTQ